MVTVEVITIGNEILLGLIQDTNSNYLCRVVRGMGGRTRRITVVRDEIDEISAELSSSVLRNPDLIVTCGGLGPTDDDLTLAAVAAATGVPISLNREARDFVQQKYKALSDAGFVSRGEMSDSRLKMARLPEGAAVVENPIGAAPAVWMRHRGTRIVCLPGVPAELKAIVEGPLQQLLGEVFGVGSYRESEIVVECGDESQLAPSLRQVAAAHPEVYIKSRASTFGPGIRFRIMTSATATTPAGAEAKVHEAIGELIRVLAQAGIQTVRSKPDASGPGKEDQVSGG